MEKASKRAEGCRFSGKDDLQAKTTVYLAAVIPHFSSLSGFDLLAAALQSLLLILTLGGVVVYLSKRTGNRNANRFFAILLLAFAACIGMLILEHLGLLARYPRLRYLPLWLTWSIGPAWFFFVKLSLFPAYRPRSSDLKHMVLPVSQALYYIICFVENTDGLREDFLFGLAASTFEEGIFLLSTLGYLFGAWRYLRFRSSELGRAPLRWDYWSVRLLRHTQRVLMFLLALNFLFVALNFFVYQTSGHGLLHIRSFYASSSLSFGLILAYMLRGVAYRRHFLPVVPAATLEQLAHQPGQRLQLLLDQGQLLRDPDLHKVRVARAIGIAPEMLDELSRQTFNQDWETLVIQGRLTSLWQMRARGRSMRQAALESGFADSMQARKAILQMQAKSKNPFPEQV